MSRAAELRAAVERAEIRLQICKRNLREANASDEREAAEASFGFLPSKR